VFDSIVQDVRHGVRILKNSPGFTTTAVLSLAIGIGANTTIFSIANTLLMRPPRGVADPSTLVDVGRTMRGSGFDTVSYPNYRDLRDRTTTLDGLYALEIEPRPMSLGGRGEAERIYGAMVSGNYFPLLGTQPALGRLMRPEDDRAGTPPVAVISYELWQRRFASDPSMTSQTIVLNGSPFHVIGITPAGFQGTAILRSDVWVPLAHVSAAAPRRNAQLMTSRQANWLSMGGRLKPGTSMAQARAELGALGAALEREFPEINETMGYTVARSARVPGEITEVAGFLGLLMGIVGLVLLIACVNLAGMLLARAAGRRREIAVRIAVGAGRARLARQVLTETVILFIFGGVAGLLVSRWLTSLLLAIIPQLPVPIGLEIPTDWRVIGFTLAASLMAAGVAGLAPALHASRGDLIAALKTDSLGAIGSRLRLRSAFVVLQVAMSLLLVIGAGLLLRSVRHSAQVDPGFDQANVDVISLDLSLTRYDPAAARGFARTLLTRLRATGGVESATLAADLPLDGGRMGLGVLQIPGHELPPGVTSFPADWNTVEPGFFNTLRIPLVKGRDFTDADGTSAPGVAIVNQTFARRVWGDGDPVGRVILSNAGTTALVRDASAMRQLTVVGVAADAHVISLSGAPEPYIYVPYAQVYVARVSLLVRTAGQTATPHVRAIMRELNPNMPIAAAMPLAQVTSIGLVPQRIAASVAGALGVVGLLLATIGVWGVTSYAVSRRTREIGIRMALGANRQSVLRLIVRQGAALAALGIALGVASAGLASGLLTSLLFGVSPLDPLTFAGACALFMTITLLASYVPARRAARVDPVNALRHD
jgi:putative ABC transport system permease protein